MAATESLKLQLLNLVGNMNSAYLLHFSAQFRAFNSYRTSSSSSSSSITLARLITLSASNSDKASSSSSSSSNSDSVSAESIREGFLQFQDDPLQSQWNVEVGNPNVPSPPVEKLSLSDQAFFLLAFIACTTSVAFTSLAIAAVPTLCAMGRTAISLSKLADTAREELPSTMAAIRLSGMEISDLTLELNDLSQEIADGIGKSTQAVQAAEAGIRQIGSLARKQTMSMIQERANLPVISLQPAVAGAAKKTSHAVGEATKKLINIISRRDSENEDDIGIDRVEI